MNAHRPSPQPPVDRPRDLVIGALALCLAFGVFVVVLAR